MNNLNEGLCTPSKAPRPGTNSSPSTSTRSVNKKATKNAKITNFFTKVNSPSNRNNSSSNHDQSENDHNQQDELSKDASSSSIKIPDSGVLEAKKRAQSNKDYVFIIPSSDDDTNVSAKGSQGRRRKAPSVHSSNSKSSDGLILTNNNNELAIGRRKNGPSSHIHNISEKTESNSNPDLLDTPSSGRDSRSRDSLPEKRRRTESATTAQLGNNNIGSATATTKITRIQPTMISSRTKMIDFQSVPSDLNLPRAHAMELIEKLFFVKMPEDFFLFWDFAKTINHRKPCSAFSHTHLDWTLVGPYDVLSGLITDFHGFSKENLARHCRFYYDPPEFQTVVVRKDSNMTHYGYYRDDPKQDNPIVVANRAALGGQISEMGDNLFTVLRTELDSSISLLSNSSQEIPPLTFSSSSSKTPKGKQSTETSLKQSQLERAKAKQELTIIRDKLIDFCSTHENLSSESWSRTNTRRSRCCSDTLNTIGIVVPNVDNTSYKGLGISDIDLDTILNEISESKDDAKTNSSSYGKYAQLRDSICAKFGENSSRASSLELGLDLLMNGDSYFHADIELLLTNAYTCSSRSPFLEILKCHLEERKKGPKVSLLEE